jgi:transposase
VVASRPFPPRTPATAAAELERCLSSSPRKHGLRRTRWRLADIGSVVPWLVGKRVASISRLLRRLGFSRKQAQKFARSPDPLYDTKWRAILRAYAQLVAQPEQVVLLFMDEVSYYRQPSPAPAYHRQGHTQPRAVQAPRANTQTRVVASLDAYSGQVVYQQRNQITLSIFTSFCAQVRAAYPQSPTIYLVLDNWPLHTSPIARAAMREQHLTPLYLPTYASWLNPIEKLWRWLRQDIIHLHPQAADLEPLREQVRQFLDQFASGSQALLHYVGLPVD